MSGKIGDNTGRASGLTKAASSAPTSAAGDPAVDRDESVGTRYINTTSGELFICTDATAGENVWQGQLGSTVQPAVWYGERGLVGQRGVDADFEYYSLATGSNATDFGDSTRARENADMCSNGTRALLGGGNY